MSAIVPYRNSPPQQRLAYSQAASPQARVTQEQPRELSRWDKFANFARKVAAPIGAGVGAIAGGVKGFATGGFGGAAAGGLAGAKKGWSWGRAAGRGAEQAANIGKGVSDIYNQSKAVYGQGREMYKGLKKRPAEDYTGYDDWAGGVQQTFSDVGRGVKQAFDPSYGYYPQQQQYQYPSYGYPQQQQQQSYYPQQQQYQYPSYGYGYPQQQQYPSYGGYSGGYGNRGYGGYGGYY
jgi:hypothetical protein